MKKLLLVLLLFISMLGCSNQKIIDISKHLYKVEKGNHHLFLLGSIEVGKEFDRVDHYTEKAYQNSDVIITETTWNQIDQREYLYIEPIKNVCQKDNLNHLMENIDKYETHLVYFRLEKMARYNPVAIFSALKQATFRELGYSSQYGIDAYFSKKGKEDNKQFDELESAKMKKDRILEISRQYGDELLQQIANHDEMVSQQKQLTNIYYHGTRKDVIDYVNHQNINQDVFKKWQLQDDHQSLIDHKIISKVEDYLKTDEVEFIMLDVKQMYGEDGLLSLFDQQGYHVISY